MPKHTNRLGKGLNALVTPRQTRLSVATADADSPSAPDADAVRQLPLASITRNPRQPRTTFHDQSLRELADSIRTNGLLQPIIVRPVSDEKFELVAGERRWRAAKLADLHTIPAIIRDLSDAQSYELALVENLQREDLAPLERATAFQQYIDTFGVTADELALRLSQSRANISNYLRLLKLRPEICQMLNAGELAMGQARAIAGISDPKRQLAVARIAARRNLSVRQVEELARSAKESAGDRQPKAQPPVAIAHTKHISDVEEAFGRQLGLRVRLYPGRRKNSGRLVIAYANLDEFDRIAERFGGGASMG